MGQITIYTDGGARGNPGPAGIGASLLDDHGTEFAAVSEYIGEQTNNYAEYTALIRALEELYKKLGDKTKEAQVEVRMDSELVVRQLSGVYKVKEPTLKELYAKVAHMRREMFPNIIFTHVRREKNKRADELVNKAIDARFA